MVLSCIPYPKAGWVPYRNLRWGIYAEFLKYKKPTHWVLYNRQPETMVLADKGEILIQFTDHTRKVGYTDNVPRCFWASQVAWVVKNSPANTRDIRDVDPTPGSGRSPGGGHGYPLQYSCQENTTDRGVWQAPVHRVTKSQTRLEQLSTHTQAVSTLACHCLYNFYRFFMENNTNQLLVHCNKILKHPGASIRVQKRFDQYTMKIWSSIRCDTAIHRESGPLDFICSHKKGLIYGI